MNLLYLSLAFGAGYFVCIVRVAFKYTTEELLAVTTMRNERLARRRS